MKAINIDYDHRKLQAISKELYKEYGWTMPKGFIEKSYKDPLNYSRQVWQQAARTNRSPKAIKAVLQDCWAASDSRAAFENVLQEHGYFLAQGDRRGHVVVDVYGEVYALARQLGIKTKDVEKRLGDPKHLPSVEETRKNISGLVQDVFSKYRAELRKDHDKEMQPLLKIKEAMTSQHRKDRAAQKEWQDKRWIEEEKYRASRIRHGFKGLWDKLTGKYWTLRKEYEKGAWAAYVRDRGERQELIERQLNQRVPLQEKIDALQAKHAEELQNLESHMGQIIASENEVHEKESSKEGLPGKFKDRAKGFGADDTARVPRSRLRNHDNDKKPDMGFDIEPDF